MFDSLVNFLNWREVQPISAGISACSLQHAFVHPLTPKMNRLLHIISIISLLHVSAPSTRAQSTPQAHFCSGRLAERRTDTTLCFEVIINITNAWSSDYEVFLVASISMSGECMELKSLRHLMPCAAPHFKPIRFAPVVFLHQ